MSKKFKEIPELSNDRVAAFLSFIDENTDDGGCWIWKGAKNNLGYGQFHITGFRPMFMAHRVSYAIFIGPIPEGYVVMHKCDNHLCVNPAHLTVGNQQENIQDMISKGRAGLVQYSSDVPY